MGEKRKDLLLLLRDHNTPLVADIAVHDVANPSLDLGGDDVGGVLGAHGNVDILAAVVDGRDGADKVLGGNALAVTFVTSASAD